VHPLGREGFAPGAESSWRPGAGQPPKADSNCRAPPGAASVVVSGRGPPSAPGRGPAAAAAAMEPPLQKECQSFARPRGARRGGGARSGEVAARID